MCVLQRVFIFQLMHLMINNSFAWDVEFNFKKLQINMNSFNQTYIRLDDVPADNINLSNYNIISDNVDIVKPIEFFLNESYITENGSYLGYANLQGVFLGQANIYIIHKNLNRTEYSLNKLKVIVIRNEPIFEIIFNILIAITISITCINFGAALNIENLKTIIKKPIGPAIGFTSQFIVMPIISFLLGMIIFPNDPEMQLGLFFVGVSPGGGASNLWAALLDANIDLSITMTTISTFSAFVMMPLWIFTLGKKIFEKADLAVPFSNIGSVILSFIIPLSIGILIQKYKPKLAEKLAKYLKPISSVILVAIFISGVVTNSFLIKLLSWQTLSCGLGLPFFGFLIGFFFAKCLKQSSKDALTISIETGIQNAGIALVMLRFTLPQPTADLTTVIILTVYFMTQFILFNLYLFKLLFKKYYK